MLVNGLARTEAFAVYRFRVKGRQADQLPVGHITTTTGAPQEALQRTWQRCADIARGRISKPQASSAAVLGSATPLNADPLGGTKSRRTQTYSRYLRS